MHTNEPRELEGVELGYDPRDIQLKPIIKVVVYFFAFTIFFFGMGAIIWINRGYGSRSRFDARKPPITGPRVQGNITAKIDIMKMRQAETHYLTTYGTEGGKQRIPVDHAMELLSERGLPAISSDEPAKSPGNTIQDNAVGMSSTPSERAPVSPAPISP